LNWEKGLFVTRRFSGVEGQTIDHLAKKTLSSDWTNTMDVVGRE
jgi:hypothetical protein